MGIPGVLKEIGKGERVALAKLAVEHLEKTQRPLRIAIDAAIWNFQTQAGHGGKNPALRTFYYRLLRILALPIHPLFVYDGKNKPLTKRGRTVSRWGPCIANTASMKLLQHFHFPHHVAPGEAEAECALLQARGIVDMVMSEDGDAIMFGSRVTLRDWSKEGTRGSKGPTHVNMLDSIGIKERSGMDPDGMILVALLSGGDYNPEGVAGFGPALACEIARAGFGQDLLELVRSGSEADISAWRERLQFELESNESGFFKRKHTKLKIPDTFPDRTLLGYYTNPAVSDDKDLKELERKWMGTWDSEINICRLRDYVGQTFDWLYKPGAWKFVRGMAPALLAYKLRLGMAEQHLRTADQITERRQHFVNGGIPELRITAVPADVVGLDLDAEEDIAEDVERLAALQIEDGAGECAGEGGGEADGGGLPDDEMPTSTQTVAKQKSPPWSPTNPEKMWIPETTVKLGAPAIVEEWEQIQRDIYADAKKFATRKTKAAKSKRATAAPKPIQQFFTVSKPVAKATLASPKTVGPGSAGGDKKAVVSDAHPLVARPRRAATKTPAVEENTAPLLSTSSRSIASFFVAAKAASSTTPLRDAMSVPSGPSTGLIAATSVPSEPPTGLIAATSVLSEPSTGLIAAIMPKRMLAQPRESLPGSWKVPDLEGEVVASRARRVNRVSYVDLTGD
ncbi:hypothetical protein DV737_g4996, partial [Chaetothyriales sp. CBS 132003]